MELDQSERIGLCVHADIDDLAREVGFRPCTDVEQGVAKFVEWYKEFYRV